MAADQATAVQAVSGRVSGVVQGVFFRASTRDRALALGLRGWVRNTADGAVEVMLVGTGDALAEMRAWLHEGPPRASVSRVDLAPCAPESGLDGFEVRG
ncbi:MAG: acylphosphatase [Pseudohongiellaceae bacterium]